jgi:hypothetical protein
MVMPGFSAESSLHMGINGYRHSTYGNESLAIRTGRTHLEARVIPAAYVDQVCAMGCTANCGDECAGLTGDARSNCIEGCRRDNDDCLRECTRPGDPPPPPPPYNPPWPPVNIPSPYSEEVCDLYVGGTTGACIDKDGDGYPDSCSVQTSEVCVARHNRTCTEWHGACTSLNGGFQCVRAPSGQLQCCRDPLSWPYIKSCDDGFNAPGCGFCLF